MTNGQRAGARRGLRGHEARAVETETGLRITLGANYRDVAVSREMTADEIEKAVRVACIQLTNG
ncbi:hypothetical protein [Hyphomonas sp. CY54-11-8]|uniref:hypothetical protein n=1 Tax=Hyphomonas sp. CY54-11-8 TaxID=1280944 RepID=UPI0012DC2027|nr:hypothetical protein [Hyphomonas sp. CY54-11-8]